MQRMIFILLLFVSWTNSYSQTVVKGNIKNYNNQLLVITTSKYDSAQHATTDAKGNFYIDLHQFSPFEGGIFLGKKKITFFSAPFDTVTIKANFKNLDNSLLISNKKTKVASSKKLKILEVEGIDSLTALIPQMGGQVTLVELWATWCGPCIAQQKIIEKYKEKYDSLGVQFLYVSMDKQDAKEKWKRFIDYTNLEGTHLLANDTLYNEINKNYGAIPLYFIIDKKGVLHRFVASETKSKGDMYSLFNKQIGELFSIIDQYLK